MDGLQSLGIDWKLLIAQILNFLILLFLLKKFLYGPIVNMLSERKEKIKQALKDTEEARTKLEQASAETRKLLSEATLESEKIVQAAKKEMEAETKKRLGEAQNKAEEIVAQSKKQATDEQNKIVEKAKREITDLAITISEKILEREADKESVNKVIEAI